MEAAEVDRQLPVALTELNLAGLIEFDPESDEVFHLTDKGFNYGMKLMETFAFKDRIIILLYKDMLANSIEEMEKKD